MKYKLAVWALLLLNSIPLSAQNFEASYKVARYLTVTSSSGKKETIQFDLEGKFYRKNNRFISFARPLYLEKYPTGIVKSGGPNQQSTAVSIYMDTIQCLSYSDLDSMILRQRNDGTGIGYEGANSVRSMEPGVSQWEIKPEKKIISGLSCQRAILKRPTTPGDIVYDIWFCPEIEMPVGIGGMLDMPGLVVEANILPLNMVWYLQSYTTQIILPDNLFWPNTFNRPFQKRAPLKSRN